MDLQVLSEVTPLSEPLLTHLSFIRPVASVMPVVVQERPFVFTLLSSPIVSAHIFGTQSFCLRVGSFIDLKLKTQKTLLLLHLNGHILKLGNEDLILILRTHNSWFIFLCNRFVRLFTTNIRGNHIRETLERVFNSVVPTVSWHIRVENSIHFVQCFHSLLLSHYCVLFRFTIEKRAGYQFWTVLGTANCRLADSNGRHRSFTSSFSYFEAISCVEPCFSCILKLNIIINFD
ncbi:unnamed protein product [Moneuplotes crassus]|uniref:Uncharacterized protein n=1 Tax=Euplotes crassus TaxID=5936 RepID=A0AAD2D4R4_EUPCR|nr:unnamed protein product [Moneuplotes crassus]